MKNNNKKYFLKETGEELEFGDIIELNCVKETEDGRVTVEKEIKFSPEAVDILMHFGLIDVEEPLIDFSDDGKDACEDCPFIHFSDSKEEDDEDFVFDEFVEEVTEDLDNHEDRITILEKEVDALKAQLNKNDSPKKK